MASVVQVSCSSVSAVSEARAPAPPMSPAYTRSRPWASQRTCALPSTCPAGWRVRRSEPSANVWPYTAGSVAVLRSARGKAASSSLLVGPVTTIRSGRTGGAPRAWARNPSGGRPLGSRYRPCPPTRAPVAAAPHLGGAAPLPPAPRPAGLRKCFLPRRPRRAPQHRPALAPRAARHDQGPARHLVERETLADEQGRPERLTLH